LSGSSGKKTKSKRIVTRNGFNKAIFWLGYENFRSDLTPDKVLKREAKIITGGTMKRSVYFEIGSG
jgi:hypothetical protein